MPSNQNSTYHQTDRSILRNMTEVIASRDRRIYENTPPPKKSHQQTLSTQKRKDLADTAIGIVLKITQAKNSDDRRKLRHLIGVVPLVMIAPNLPISSVGPAGIAALDFAGNS